MPLYALGCRRYHPHALDHHVASPRCYRGHGADIDAVKAFCKEKQFHDSDTVTEGKLLLFIVKVVADRPLRTKSRKVDKTQLTWRSVRGYITAITDLYRVQKAIGMNSHLSPWEDNVQQILKILQQRDARHEKDQYIRG